MTMPLSYVDHAVAVHQIDTVKTRLQLSGELGAARQYTGMLDGLRTIAATEGLLGWFKGLSPALLRQATYGTIRYGAYEVRRRARVGLCVFIAFALYHRLYRLVCHCLLVCIRVETAVPVTTQRRGDNEIAIVIEFSPLLVMLDFIFAQF